MSGDTGCDLNEPQPQPEGATNHIAVRVPEPPYSMVEYIARGFRDTGLELIGPIG
jgi:hypothetical protein